MSRQGEPPQNSSLAATYLKLDSAELDSATVADALTGALVSPVITAHPTETRRRTVFDTQHRITELMRLRLHGHAQTDDGRDIERELRRHILTLWQTALIRLSRLKIQDEIETGLRYYPAAFFEVIPQVNAEVRDRAAGPLARRAICWSQPILRPGSWIGGDRDGNPNVTADVVRLATGSAALHRAGALLRRTHRAGAGTVDVGAAGARSATSSPRWPTRATSRPAPTSRTAARCGSSTARLTATARRDPGPPARARARPRA